MLLTTNEYPLRFSGHNHVDCLFHSLSATFVPLINEIGMFFFPCSGYAGIYMFVVGDERVFSVSFKHLLKEVFFFSERRNFLDQFHQFLVTG